MRLCLNLRSTLPNEVLDAVKVYVQSVLKIELASLQLLLLPNRQNGKGSDFFQLDLKTLRVTGTCLFYKILKLLDIHFIAIAPESKTFVKKSDPIYQVAHFLKYLILA